MDTVASDLDLRRKRRRKQIYGYILGLGVPVVVGGIVVASQIYDVPIAARGVELSAERYRAAGYPWTAKDVAPNPPIRPEENAAPALEKALAAMPKGFDYKVLLEVRKAANAKRYADVANMLVPGKPAFDLAERATRCTGYDSGLDFDRPYYRPPVKGADADTFFGLLSFRVIALAGIGDVDGALSMLRTNCRWIVLLAREPTQGSLRQASENSFYLAYVVEKCTELFQSNPEGLAEMKAILDATSPAVDHERGLRIQIYESLASLRIDGVPQRPWVQDVWNNGSGEEAWQEPPPQREGLPQGLSERGYGRRFFDMWVAAKPILDRTKNDPERLYAELQQFEEKFADRIQQSYSANSYLGPPTDLSNYEKQIQADLLTQKALVAAMLVKLKTGRLPSRIEDIPGRWTDPYTGQPLRISSKLGDYRIYSVGEGKDDNLGVANFEHSGARGDDVGGVFPARTNWR